MLYEKTNKEKELQKILLAPRTSCFFSFVSWKFLWYTEASIYA